MKDELFQYRTPSREFAEERKWNSIWQAPESYVFTDKEKLLALFKIGDAIHGELSALRRAIEEGRLPLGVTPDDLESDVGEVVP